MLLETNNYKVVLIEDSEDPGFWMNEDPAANYAVVNIKTDRTEQACTTLPQAFLTATQLDRLIQTNYHKVIVESMYGGGVMPTNADVIKLFDDGEDEGELH